MSIPFTQYLRPDGRKKDVLVDMDPKVEKVAHLIMKKDGYFECEELANGTVVLYCYMNKGQDQDKNLAAMKLCPNGPEIPKAVEELIYEAKSKFFPGPT